MAALSDQDDPLAPAKPLSTGYSMPDYLQGAAPIGAKTPAPAPAAPPAQPAQKSAVAPAPTPQPQERAAPQAQQPQPRQPARAAPGANGVLGLTNTVYGAPLDHKGAGGFSAADAYQYAKSVGASDNEALFLCGAAANESSFNPSVVHDGGKGYGLFGHNLQRLDMRWQPWQNQMKMALQELRSRPEHAEVAGAKTPEQLAIAQMRYEQPMGYTSSNPQGGLNYTGRYNTLVYFSQMNNGVFNGANGAPVSGAVPRGAPATDHSFAQSAQGYAMPAGAEGSSYQPEYSQLQPEAAKPEEKKFDWDSIAKPAEKKFDWDSIAVADGAKKVNEEAGTDGKGFIGRTYDKLVSGQKIVSGVLGLAGKMLDEAAPGAGVGAKAASAATDPENVKGVESGVAQDVTGVGELLPGAAGAASARATDQLKTFGNPGAQTLGQLAGYLAPVGEIAGTAKGIQAAEGGIAKAAELGKGAAEGFGLGMATPVGSKGQDNSLADRALAKAPYGMLGAVGGAAPPIVGEAVSLGKGLGQKAAAAKTTLPEELAETQRGRVLEHSGKITTENEEAAKAIKPQEEAAKKDLAYMNEQVEQAQKDAEKAGMAKAEAAKFAEGRRQELEQAKKSADELVAANLKRPASTPEEMSARMRPIMERDYAELKKTREVESGFSKAVKSDGGKPSISTSALIDKAEALSKNTKNDDLAALAKDMAKKLVSEDQKAVSIREAREILTDMNTKMDALDPASQHRLQPLIDELQSTMEKTHDQMRVAREKYAELSRPLDPYERQGVAARGIKTDLYSKAPVVDSTKLVGSILRSGEAGADHLGALIQKDKSLREDAEKYFNGQLFGYSGKVVKPDAQAYGKFLSDNRQALEKSGLTAHFSDLAGAQAKMEANVKAATDAAKTAEKAEKDAAALASKAEQASKAAESRAETSQKAVSELAEKRAKHEAAAADQKAFEGIVKSDNPKEVAQSSRTFFEKMRKEGRIDDEQLTALKREADKIDQAFKTRDEAEKALRTYKNFLVGSGIATAVGMGSAAVGSTIYLRNLPQVGH